MNSERLSKNTTPVMAAWLLGHPLCTFFGELTELHIYFFHDKSYFSVFFQLFIMEQSIFRDEKGDCPIVYLAGTLISIGSKPSARYGVCWGAGKKFSPANSLNFFYFQGMPKTKVDQLPEVKPLCELNSLLSEELWRL